MDKNNNYVNFNLDDLQGFGGNEELTSFDYTRYLNVIKKRKWWIAAITVVVTIAWIIQDYYLFSPKYETTAVIHFNRADKQNPVESFDNTKAEGKVEILKTKNFLGRVVDSLHLNFKLKYPDEFRSKVFKDINIEYNAPYGNFRIAKNGAQFDLYRLSTDDKGEEIANKIFTGNLGDKSSELSHNGFHLTFNTKTLEQHKKIEFNYSPAAYAVGGLKNNMRPELDQSETILYIKYKDKDPYLATDITNTIATLFISYMSEFRHLYTNSMLTSLTRQLKAAQEELGQSENSLKTFRTQNPYVYIDRKGERTINKTTVVEDDVVKLDRDVQFITALLAKRDEIENFEELNFVYQEILSFLDAERVPGASIFSLQYLNYVNERQTLLDQLLPPQNLEVVKVTEKIMALRQQIDQRAKRYITDTARLRQEYMTQINSDRSNLRVLPQVELRLAELNRDHDIKEKIVEDILEKYNEAKIFQNTILPEATLIDPAERPGVMKNAIQAKSVFTGLILGLIMGIGLFVGREVFDNTIKSPKEIKDNLKLPVLVTVPFVNEEKLRAEINGNANNGHSNGHLDPNLITMDYAPTLENEVFRRLRVKLTSSVVDEHMTIPVTSLNPNEGKSFISSNLAITFAQQKRLTLLIDGDVRRGVLHKSFNVKKTPGLTDILMSNCTIDADNVAKIIQKTNVPNLFMIPTGQPVPNPLEILGSHRMAQLHEFLKANFATIIIDTPPFGLVPDIFTFKKFLKEAVLVTRFEKTNMNQLKEALNDFNENDMHIRGVVFNASKEEYKRYGKYYKYSYYSY